MDGCIVWQGRIHKRGYGEVTIGRGADGWPVRVRAHRVAWEEAFGPIPNGLCVLHKCDNPPCVNPEHLFLGTRADNNRDRFLKGRDSHDPKNVGHRNGRARLTVAQVEEIRALAATGMQRRALAERYGVARTTVSAVVAGQNWAGLH